MKDIKLTEKQSQMILSTANEVAGGGSASGGKSFLNKIIAIMVADQVPGAQIAILRNTSKNLSKNYFLGNESIPSLLKDHIQAKLVTINYTDMVVKWVNTGSAIHFMHCENVAAACDNLTGLEFALVIFDECSLVDSSVIEHAKTRLRLGSLKIKDPFWAARLPRLQLTTNPGGISHSYFKEKYVSPAPPGTEFVNEYGSRVLFIPFGARENPHIDYEAYERQLRSTGDEVKYKRLALGDWDVGEGAFFEASFKRHKNVVRKFVVPADWKIFRGMDHGYSSPFCVLWIAKVNGSNEIKLDDGRDLYLPNGSFVVIDEWYGCNPKDRSVGIMWSGTEIAKGVLSREEESQYPSKVSPGAADNSIWSHLSAKSIADEMGAEGVRFTRSDKSPGSRTRGWMLVADMLKSAHVDGKIEKPCLIIFDHCVHLITDLSTVPTSKKNSDDVDTNGTDHTLDALRYMLATPDSKLTFAPMSGL
jgi:hypothetical protein